MNYAVDALNENPQEVARQFLVDRGLL